MSEATKRWASPEQVAKDIEQLGAHGYESLSLVLRRAFLQAAEGKGNERHANGEPFDEQVMQTGAHRFGVGALLFQAFKKSEESQRLPHDRAVAELLGAINYLAGAVIAMERKHQVGDSPTPANDNVPEHAERKSKSGYVEFVCHLCPLGERFELSSHLHHG